MADYQRIHPHRDNEASQRPTVPLVPRGSSKSDSSDAAPHYPPFRRTIPVAYSKPPKKRNCCCRCLCWTTCLLLILLVLVAITAGIIFLVFRPKLPQYSIDGLRITQFNLTDDGALHANSAVNITARNPNKNIGIYYEGGSRIRVSYMGTVIGDGSLPEFYQGYRNTTVLRVALTGQIRNAAGLLSSLQEQQQTGSIPLNLRARVPVRIKLGTLKLMKVKFLVRCRLVVDSLTADNVIRIRNSSCRFRFRL